MISSSKTALLLLSLGALTLTMFTANAAEAELKLSPEEIEKIFLEFDIEDVDETPDCQEPEVEAVICPKDAKIPCGEMKGIEEHCASVLGPDITKAAQAHEPLSGKNAYNGCIVYTSYHVFEHNHVACCESDPCEEWLMAQFDEMFPENEEDGAIVDDDDDDDEVDEDDDEDDEEEDGKDEL